MVKAKFYEYVIIYFQETDQASSKTNSHFKKKPVECELDPQIERSELLIIF